MIRLFNLTFFVFLFLITKANSLIEIDITRGNLDPLPIAVSPLFQDDNSKKNSINELKIKNKLNILIIILQAYHEHQNLKSYFSIFHNHL